MKWHLALFPSLLLMLLTTVSNAAGFKVATEGSRMFTYYGKDAVYQDEKDKTHCKFNDKIDSVDNDGNAYKAFGFKCNKNLYIVIKQYKDNENVSINLVSPLTGEIKKVYNSYWLMKYREDKDE